MTKQEYILKINSVIQKGSLAGISLTPESKEALMYCAGLAMDFDEPSLGECELISNEYNICSCCSYNLNNLIKEIVVGCDTDDCECGRAVVHQIFWTDKYMNYCPNCGVKIKRKVKNENL